MATPTPPGEALNVTNLSGHDREPVTIVTLSTTSSELVPNTEDTQLLPNIQTTSDQSTLGHLSSSNHPVPDQPSTLDVLTTFIQSAITNPPPTADPPPPDHVSYHVHPTLSQQGSDQQSASGRYSNPSTSEQAHVSDQLAELLQPTLSALPPSSGLIKCPPFCHGHCVVQHHPLLVALLNCEDTGAMELMDMKLCILKSVIHKFKQGSLKWTYEDPIPDVVPEYRYPMIHWACMLGRVGAAVWLIGHQYSVSTTQAMATFDGDIRSSETGLHKALRCLQETCPTNAGRKFVQLMSVMEPAISVADKFGDTPIHACCRMLRDGVMPFYSECLQNMILELSKARNPVGVALVLNMKNNNGETALHFLSSWNRLLPHIMLLRQFGANPLIPNKEGVTAKSLMENTPSTDITTENIDSAQEHQTPSLAARVHEHAISAPVPMQGFSGLGLPKPLGGPTAEGRVVPQVVQTSSQSVIMKPESDTIPECISTISPHLSTHESIQTVTQPSPAESVLTSLLSQQSHVTPADLTASSSDSLSSRPASDLKPESMLNCSLSASSEAAATSDPTSAPPTVTPETNQLIVNSAPVPHIITEFPLARQLSEKLPSPKNEALDTSAGRQISRRCSNAAAPLDGRDQRAEIAILREPEQGAICPDATGSLLGAVGGIALDDERSRCSSSPTPMTLFDTPTDEDRLVQKYYEDTVNEMSAKNGQPEAEAPKLEEYQALLEEKQFESAAYHLYSPRETPQVVDRIELLKTADSQTQLAMIEAILQKRNKALEQLSLSNRGIACLQQKYRDKQQQQDSVVKEIMGIVSSLNNLQHEEKTMNSELTELDMKNASVTFTNDHLKERLGNCQDAIAVLKRLHKEERMEKATKQRKT